MLYAATQSAVNVTVVRCIFEDCSLGNTYTTVDEDDVGGLIIEDSLLNRASTSNLPSAGYVMNRCAFNDSITAGGDPFVMYRQDKWLVLNCEWFRTVRGIVMQIIEGSKIQIGVLAACRFTDVGLIASGAGEVILCEAYSGDADTLSYNTFIFCQMIDCTGPGIWFVGGGFNHNHFYIFTIDTMAGSVFLDGTTATTHDNLLEYFEIGSNFLVAGQSEDNTFRFIVALRNPIRAGNSSPGYPYTYYTTSAPSYDRVTAPFRDSSTHAPGHPNQYSNIFESRYDSVLRIWQFPDGQGAPG